MSALPHSRVAVLAALVVLATVQPVPGALHSADAAPDVGDAAGSTVNRHPSSAGATEGALRSVRADAVHAEGLTGRGVAVGVIGRDFDPGALGDHVADRRQVGSRSGAPEHDTAVAEVVTETAPSSELYLAGIGRTPTPEEYAAAVDWLTAQGVEVIVDSGSYFPSVAADERRITAAADRATDRGVVFVTSAGNYADRHWAGEGSTTADGWVEFADGNAANALADGDRLAGRVTVRLRWRSAADYDLYLYRRLPDAQDRVVAKSTDETTSPGLTVEGIDVAVPRGQYYLAVYADDRTERPGQVQVFAARHELQHTTARGSMVAPATSESVVAVGASSDGDRLPYSSRAETGGADLTAPASAGARGDLAGTSAAAPYVAGTAALMKASERDLSPDEVGSILERTAADEDGRLDALAAVEAARTDSAGGATPDDDAPVARDDGAAADAAATGPTLDPEMATGATVAREGRNVTQSGGRNVTQSGGNASVDRSGTDREAATGRDDPRENDSEPARPRGDGAEP